MSSVTVAAQLTSRANRLMSRYSGATAALYRPGRRYVKKAMKDCTTGEERCFLNTCTKASAYPGGRNRRADGDGRNVIPLLYAVYRCTVPAAQDERASPVVQMGSSTNLQ